MTHDDIYNTLHLSPEVVKDLLGAGDLKAVNQKREKMQTFLRYNKWSVDEYKKWLKSGAWTPQQPSRGRGDTIAKVTNAVGMKACGGCKERQKKLNERFPVR